MPHEGSYESDKTDIIGAPGASEERREVPPDEEQEEVNEEPSGRVMAALALDPDMVGKLGEPKDGEPVSLIVQGKLSSTPDGYVLGITKMDRVEGNPSTLGSGERFKALESQLSSKGKVRDPAATAASIGRAKYGKERFQRLAASGR